ncbi:MAG: BrnT family toxin [SAR202 cluster bacterium]|jgi:uncharacterized DUF497 family protein|nr:hypothetical protein [Chloroflexota bacterium]MDP6421387.1 BrnT family toxin [SAR202 cluster bacterium]HAL47893.1 hypothetical protein [Dehalococcoidia bacterium]MDP6665036.1 BrnT family toxin [SAR202 cluster bacterium]MDP6801297.1 BrnT family toxin [SAR202 cluster bacterium]|tara:strand:- start:8124 stop:8435 length:312 start_codon:yes stop_codon:yes gene_type:complete
MYYTTCRSEGDRSIALYVERLSWDEQCEDHIARHGVTFEEVEQAVGNLEYVRRSRGYYLTLGQTDAGRYLVVILDDEGDGVWHPVTARDMQRSERRLLRRKRS